MVGSFTRPPSELAWLVSGEDENISSPLSIVMGVHQSMVSSLEDLGIFDTGNNLLAPASIMRRTSSVQPFSEPFPWHFVEVWRLMITVWGFCRMTCGPGTIL